MSWFTNHQIKKLKAENRRLQQKLDISELALKIEDAKRKNNHGRRDQ